MITKLKFHKLANFDFLKSSQNKIWWTNLLIYLVEVSKIRKEKLSIKILAMKGSFPKIRVSD